ncbi:porin family protein [Tenuifilum thalassicum]|uniref:PorT family protein n=1 Tax=Tenuifilum thalassicum TaxID=2590900 RepID=A0A7D3Y4G2_9BACT|nr:porin family protein [Tenuifilum thalassicum]QKG79969.1 PorT family protein [Tenuifilum thalassicum]
MKKLLFILVLVGFSLTSSAQFLRFGVKGGVSSTNVKFDKTTIDNGVNSYLIEQGDAKLGMHLGFFARIQVMGFFAQPELLFSHSQGEVVLNDLTASQVYNETQKFNKVDIPVLVGWKFGPARIGFGPVATVLLSENDGLKDKLTDLTNQTVKNNFNSATFGYQIGLGLDILKKVTLDVRYEGNLSKLGSGITIGNNEYSFDQRNPQILFSAGIFF